MKSCLVHGLVILLLLTVLAGGAYLLAGKFLDDRQQEIEQARKEMEPPTLTLEGKEVVKLQMGQAFKEPGFAAADAFGEDLTDKVQVEVPTFDKTGSYAVHYRVEDARGNVTDKERTVKVDWPKLTKAGRLRGLSVIMYHDVYDVNDLTVVPNPNKVSTATLEEELKYLVEEGYYFPTWEEVRRYVDGKIELPEKSVVLTFDDATKGFLENGIPLLEKYDVHATSFVITSKKGKKIAKLLKKHPPAHVEFQSHSHDMHRPGGVVGHGGVMTALSVEEAAADLKESQRILGTSDAFAYPFGDYNASSEEAVKQAGFKVAFTTQYGKIHPGNDPLLLPRMRSNGNVSLETFKGLL